MGKDGRRRCGGSEVFWTAVVLFASGISVGLAGDVGSSDNLERWASVGLVRSSGNAGFDENQAGWRSKLEFPVDGTLVEIRGGARRPVEVGRQPAWVAFSGRYAASLSAEGRSSDFDWDSSGNLSDYSHSDCTAEIRIWEVKVAWSTLFNDLATLDLAELGLHIGYGADWFDFSDEDLDVVYDYGQTIYSIGGPSATYEIEFTGFRIGGFAQLQPCDPLTVRVELDWIPALHAESDALWIMRDYPFWQEADGQGVVLSLRADWKLSSSLSLFGGARYVSLIADEDGVEGGVLNGLAYDNSPIVSEMTAEYYGIEFGAGWWF